MSCQSAGIARLTELDCTSQPRWSAGHDKLSVVPLTLTVMFVGFKATPLTTLRTPFVGLKLQASPLPGEPAILLKLPLLKAALKSVNVSPTSGVPEAEVWA